MISRVQQQLISFASAGKDRAIASFGIGIPALPYLADHGFQDLTVLPGSFYLELALGLQVERLGLPRGRMVEAKFEQPLILGAEPAIVSVEMSGIGTGRVGYVFRDAGGTAAPLAVLEIQDGAGALVVVEAAARRFSVQESGEPPLLPKSSAPAPWENAASTYDRLRRNGNQYGPRFQGLAQIGLQADRATARLAAPIAPGEIADHHLHPVLLDTAIQLLGAAAGQDQPTFVLRGIAEVRFGPAAPSAFGSLEAVWRPAAGGNQTGDVTVFNSAGALMLEVRGIAISYLGADSAPELVIAATFTAEPIEPALRYWSEAAALPARISFAPYAQIFQELLKPESQFRRNAGGLNVILLNLGDWVRRSGAELAPRAEAGPKDWNELERHTLAGGFEVAHLNRHETEYVHREIFEDQCYLRHGIHLSGASNVIDIGANIGLFSLFVRSQSPAAEVFAYEPSPIAFRALEANCTRYGPGLHPFNVGVSDRRGRAELTFYEKSSVFSSFHPNPGEDRSAIRAVVANMVQNELRDSAAVAEDYVDELMTDRLDSRTFDCPLVAVSDIIRDNRLQWVDLLKIDAEKCELEILRGIEAEHWPLIGQVVIEVHDATGRAVAEVRSILESHGFRCGVEEERLLSGSGLYNVYATRPGTPGPSLVADLQGKAEQLAQALEAFSAAARAPTLVALCPAQTRSGAQAAALKLVEDEFLRRIEALPRVAAIGSRALLGRFPECDWFDPHTDRLGHIPYGAEGFAALGTSVFRAFAAVRRAPYKVIALDCDHTLWDGGCGEDGIRGVAVPAARRTVQEFMLRQMRAGMILCLCSKNQEADVWAVFEGHAAMALKREHVAAARINWSPKSENLRALAAELNVGLESFIFVDDNPAECAEVRAHCPGPLVIQLPAEGEAAAGLLEQVWAFDHLGATAEDGRRTQLVKESAERERFRSQTATLADFIAGLELSVEMDAPGEAEAGRLAQLTQRTNQFNFTGRRRTEGELSAFLAQPGSRGLAVRVRDRFGDYGLVGLVLWEALSDRCRLDTFVLSCRVLGRGVEHRILAEVGRRAQAEGQAGVELELVPTEKNLPAREFLRAVAGPGLAVRMAAGELAGLRFKVEAAPSPLSGEKSGEPPLPPQSRSPHADGEITFSTPKDLAAAIESHRLRAAGFAAGAEPEPVPANLSGRLLQLYRRVLANPRIGLDDNFLDAGGTSLKAVQLVAAIRRELGHPISVVNFFESPTIRRLSEKLEPSNVSGAGTGAAGEANEALERGARRNQRLKRPRGPE